MIDKFTPLVPKNPEGPLMVLVLGRVSTPHQDIKNIEASYEDVERFPKSIHDGPTEIKHLGEQGSGMLVDRASIMEAEREIETGNWDLVLKESPSASPSSNRRALLPRRLSGTECGFGSLSCPVAPRLQPSHKF